MRRSSRSFKRYETQNALHFVVNCVILYRMAKTRTSTLNLRIHPSLKDAVREAAAREHRSVANMVEVLIRRHCDQSGITVYEKSDLSSRRRNG
jgi:hypothetical protein